MDAIFGYQFKDPNLLRIALTHRSIEHVSTQESNRSLAYLGDSVLDAIVIKLLINKFGRSRVEDLNNGRNQLVSNQALANLVKKLDCEKLLTATSDSLLKGRVTNATFFEAIIGAIFLDGGYDAAHSIVSEIFLERIQTLKFAKKFKAKPKAFSKGESKSQLKILMDTLHKYCRNNDLLYSINEIDRSGDAAALKDVKVVVDGELLGKATGKTSYKKLKIKAIRQALELLNLC